MRRCRNARGNDHNVRAADDTTRAGASTRHSHIIREHPPVFDSRCPVWQVRQWLTGSEQIRATSFPSHPYSHLNPFYTRMSTSRPRSTLSLFRAGRQCTTRASVRHQTRHRCLASVTAQHLFQAQPVSDMTPVCTRNSTRVARRLVIAGSKRHGIRPHSTCLRHLSSRRRNRSITSKCNRTSPRLNR